MTIYLSYDRHYLLILWTFFFIVFHIRVNLLSHKIYIRLFVIPQIAKDWFGKC